MLNIQTLFLIYRACNCGNNGSLAGLFLLLESAATSDPLLHLRSEIMQSVVNAGTRRNQFKFNATGTPIKFILSQCRLYSKTRRRHAMRLVSRCTQHKTEAFLRTNNSRVTHFCSRLDKDPSRRNFDLGQDVN